MILLPVCATSTLTVIYPPTDLGAGLLGISERLSWQAFRWSLCSDTAAYLEAQVLDYDAVSPPLLLHEGYS